MKQIFKILDKTKMFKTIFRAEYAPGENKFPSDRWENIEFARVPVSIPLGRTRERDVDRLLCLVDIVILAISLPTLGNHLHQKFSGRDHRHMAHSGLVGLQIHLDLLVLAVLVLFDESN